MLLTSCNFEHFTKVTPFPHHGEISHYMLYYTLHCWVQIFIMQCLYTSIGTIDTKMLLRINEKTDFQHGSTGLRSIWFIAFLDSGVHLFTAVQCDKSLVNCCKGVEFCTQQCNGIYDLTLNIWKLQSLLGGGCGSWKFQSMLGGVKNFNLCWEGELKISICIGGVTCCEVFICNLPLSVGKG